MVDNLWSIDDFLSQYSSQGTSDPNTGGFLPEIDEVYNMEDFWGKAIGVVTPHRAQQGKIISSLQKAFRDVPDSLIRGAVDTVERFQGQERDIIIASFSLGDPDVIYYEDEFLMSLNRFNVMSSRARAKLIVFVSEEVVNHLSSDIQTLRESSLLKTYVETFCHNFHESVLGYIYDQGTHFVRGLFKYT